MKRGNSALPGPPSTPGSFYGTLKAGRIELILSPDGVAVAPINNKTLVKGSTMFQGSFVSMKEIVWDHREKQVAFIMADGRISDMFSIPQLLQLEMQISSLFEVDLSHQPKYFYIGVQIGVNPSSPIQQRRRLTMINELSNPNSSYRVLQSVVLTGLKRRELLQGERPLRNATSRERLAIDFFRTGYLSFSCSINGDVRGLKLDVFFLSVFPSPDCHDRSACLFSYPYESVNSCKASQNRIELRFKRAIGPGAAKQPTYLLFQSREAQHIREAVCYLKHGVYREVLVRDQTYQVSQAVAKTLETESTAKDAARTIPLNKVGDIFAAKRQARLLTYIDDEESLVQRIDSRCRMIGCMRSCESSLSDKSSGLSNSNLLRANSAPSCQQVGNSTSVASPPLRAGLACLCDEHAAMVCGSPPKGPSRLKRAASGGFFASKDKSTRMIAHSMLHLVQAGHFAKTLRYQGMLLKQPGSSNTTKRQGKKSWHQKIAVVIETPVGGFLCYYDKLSHCPGMTDTPKERRVIDLSAVLCIRPESASTYVSPSPSSNGASGQSVYAFDILTLYRSWTFACTDPVEYEIWLNVLTDAVERLTSWAPDKPLRFSVRIVNDRKSGGRSSSREDAILEISANGVSVMPSVSGGTPVVTEGTEQHFLGSWYFTDIQKWSVAAHQGEQCCLLTCLSSPTDKVETPTDQRPPLSTTLSAPTLPISTPSHANPANGPRYNTFLLQTPDAPAICQAIEFYVGKCLAKLEVLTVEYMEKFVKERESGVIDSGNLHRSNSSQAVSISSSQRGSVERAKSEQNVMTKPTPAGYECSGMQLPKLKAPPVVDSKEHPLLGVSLEPIAVPFAAHTSSEMSTSSHQLQEVQVATKSGCSSADENPIHVQIQSSPGQAMMRDSADERSRAETATLPMLTSMNTAECTQAIELDMVRLEFLDTNDKHSEDSSTPPPTTNTTVATTISAMGALDADLHEIHRHDKHEGAEGDDENQELIEAINLEQEVAVVPLLDSASVVDVNVDIVAINGIQDLSSDDARTCEEDEELDRFQSFEYCICHVGETDTSPVGPDVVPTIDNSGAAITYS